MAIGFDFKFDTAEEFQAMIVWVFTAVIDLKKQLAQIAQEDQRLEARLDSQDELLQGILQKLDLAIQAGADPLKLAQLSGKIESTTESVSGFDDTVTKP